MYNIFSLNPPPTSWGLASASSSPSITSSDEKIGILRKQSINFGEQETKTKKLHLDSTFSDFAASEERFFPECSLTKLFKDLEQDFVKIHIPITGQGIRQYILPRVIVKQLPNYANSSFENMADAKEVSWDFDGKSLDESVVYLFFQSLKCRYLKKVVKELHRLPSTFEQNLQKDPDFLDDFLALNSRNCIEDVESQAFSADTVTESCLNDKTGKKLINYLLLASNEKYPFIKKGWLEALSKLVEIKNDWENEVKDSREVDHFAQPHHILNIYQAIFAYLKETPSLSSTETELVHEALIKLFPANIPFSNTAAARAFMEGLCCAWLSLRFPTLNLDFLLQIRPKLKECQAIQSNHLEIDEPILYKSQSEELGIMAILSKYYPEDTWRIIEMARQFPKHAASFFYLGVFRYLKHDNDLEKAQDCFQETLKRDLAYGDVLIEIILGWKKSRFESENKINQVKLLLPLLNFFPKNFKVLNFLAFYYYDSAFGKFLAIYYCDSTFGMLNKEDSLKEAVSYFSRALEVEHDIKTMIGYAYCLKELNQTDQAYAVTTAAFDMLPENEEKIFLSLELYLLCIRCLNKLEKTEVFLKEMPKVIEVYKKGTKKEIEKIYLDLIIHEFIPKLLKSNNFKDTLALLLELENLIEKMIRSSFKYFDWIRQCYFGLGRQEESLAILEALLSKGKFKEISNLFTYYETCVLLKNEEKAEVALKQLQLQDWLELRDFLEKARKENIIANKLYIQFFKTN